MDESFVKAPIEVPHLSGFDKSHQNLLSTKVGTITPILIDELMPGSKVNLKLALSASLPPLASETFMRTSVKVEAFFVPFRLLVGSFESWFTDVAERFATSGNNQYEPRKGCLPTLGAFGSTTTGAELSARACGVGTLGDYLGLKTLTPSTLADDSTVVSALPFLAYHRVYDDHYRNTLVQAPVFLRPAASTTNGPLSSTLRASTMPYYFKASYSAMNTSNTLLLADGKSLLDLRQRNFGLDYFTTATPNPQAGQPASFSFNVVEGSGSVSIAAVRAANSMQQFRERNNLPGMRFQDQIFGRYGVKLSNGVAQRSLLLGSASFDVYSKGIYQTSSKDNRSPNNQNPWSDTTGARYGSAYADGADFVISGFEANEPGYILVNATLVPRVTYSSGVDRKFLRYCKDGSLSEMANPILQSVGPESISTGELTGNLRDTEVFGYTDRFASFKTMQDELHGILRDGQTLAPFALQRSFPFDSSSGGYPEISSAFLEIPTNYLDQIAAVNGEIAEYGTWMDVYFDYKVAQPLAKYSLPTLQDPAYEHGRTIIVNRSGNSL